MSLQPGDKIRTRNIDAYLDDGVSRIGFTAKGLDRGKAREDKKAFVFLFLGVESLVHDPEDSINPVEFLKSLGWTPPPGLEEEDGEDKWEGIDPWFRKAAELALEGHNAKGSVIGGRRFSEVQVTAKDLDCNGVQLRQLSAKRYWNEIAKACENVGIVLTDATFQKPPRKGQSSFILMRVWS